MTTDMFIDLFEMPYGYLITLLTFSNVTLFSLRQLRDTSHSLPVISNFT
jgi:hypothetical protein